jgi:hypothetical protein
MMFRSNAKSRTTQRAADLGYAPRYFDIYLALSFPRFDGESALPPQAANASRWATQKQIIFRGNASEEPHTMHPYKYLRILQSVLGASCAFSGLCFLLSWLVA